MDYNWNIVNWVQANLNPVSVLTKEDRNALKWVETGAKICSLPKTEQKCRNILNGTEQADKEFLKKVHNAYAECGCFVNDYYLYLTEA